MELNELYQKLEQAIDDKINQISILRKEAGDDNTKQRYKSSYARIAEIINNMLPVEGFVVNRYPRSIFLFEAVKEYTNDQHQQEQQRLLNNFKNNDETLTKLGL